MENRLSYSRLTALPSNIAAFGSTKEELATGRPDGNPMLSPMPDPRVPEAKLALSPGGSDRLRLSQPHDPELNPHEGPKPALVLTRSAVRKLQGAVLGQLQGLVQSVPDTSLQERMQDSLRRVIGLRESVARLNQMAELVMVRSRSEGRA